MRSVQALSAVALAAGFVSAQRPVTCDESVTVTASPPVITCDVIDGDLVVDGSLSGPLVLDGPTEIRGDLVALGEGDGGITSLESTTLETIEGQFKVEDLTLLGNINMQVLTSLGSLNLTRLRSLSMMTFGLDGELAATGVSIVDTGIEDLSGLALTTVKTIAITSNEQLEQWDSSLVNITGELIVTNNGGASGRGLAINMTDLEMAGEMQLNQVRAFNTPNLAEVTKSLKFDSNPELVSFNGDNITTIGESLTFIKNDKLANITFESLTRVGDMTIQNNTELLDINKFSELETIDGALVLAGAFESVDLPSLNAIFGTATVTSTTDIQSFCDDFNEIDDRGDIRGDAKCTSNNDDALENGDGGDEDTGSTSGGGNDDEDDDGAAAGLTVNLAILGLTAVAGLAQLL